MFIPLQQLQLCYFKLKVFSSDFIDSQKLEIKVGGGGPLGFGQIIFRGYLGLSENLGVPLFSLFMFFLHFYVTIFWTLSPSPPLPPMCIYFFQYLLLLLL